MPNTRRTPHRLVILSGLSGSGKTVALNMLEDLGWYCVDNVPARLLKEFARATVATRDPAYHRMAVGVDARNKPEELAAIPRLRDELATLDVGYEIVFLQADLDVLFKRFSETRRKHPLSGADLSLQDAIEREVLLLKPIKDHADLVLDTNRTTIHELRELVRQRVHREESRTLSLLFESFAFKHGIPADADFVFDVRCLPNPHWEAALRPLTGRDPAVVEYLEGQASVRTMLRDITTFLETWIPQFEASNRSYVTVAIGCTGGQHRSVYLVERLGAHFRDNYEHVVVRHGELD
jgi:UPF0042 nucleotide-binding protein